VPILVTPEITTEEAVLETTLPESVLELINGLARELKPLGTEVCWNPTGSVVAVTFWALANGKAARTAAAARVRDVDLSLMMFDVFWLGLEG
jgi:hypothetical protein